MHQYSLNQTVFTIHWEYEASLTCEHCNTVLCQDQFPIIKESLVSGIKRLVTIEQPIPQIEYIIDIGRERYVFKESAVFKTREDAEAWLASVGRKEGHARD